MKNILFIGLLAAVLILANSCVKEQRGCTEEAKICPDGSTVTRTLPSCEFDLCPSSKEKYCKQDSDCEIKYQIYYKGTCDAGCFNKDIKANLDKCGNTMFEIMNGNCKCIANQCQFIK